MRRVEQAARRTRPRLPPKWACLPDYQDLLTKVRGTQLVHLEDMTGAEG